MRAAYWGVEEKIGSVTDTWCDVSLLPLLLVAHEAKKEPFLGDEKRGGDDEEGEEEEKEEGGCPPP